MKTVRIKCPKCGGSGGVTENLAGDRGPRRTRCPNCNGTRFVDQAVPVDDIVVPAEAEMKVEEGEGQRRRDADAYTSALVAMAEKTKRLEGEIKSLARAVVDAEHGNNPQEGGCPFCWNDDDEGHTETCIVHLAKKHTK